MGNVHDPLKWGWCLKNGKMMPIYTYKAPAPASLLKMIKFGCKTDCNKRICTCFKYNLKCSVMCGECRGMYCLNHQPSIETVQHSDIAWTNKTSYEITPEMSSSISLHLIYMSILHLFSEVCICSLYSTFLEIDIWLIHPLYMPYLSIYLSIFISWV